MYDLSDKPLSHVVAIKTGMNSDMHMQDPGSRRHHDAHDPTSRFYKYESSNTISNGQSSCTRPIANFAPVLNPETDIPVILHLPLGVVEACSLCMP